MNLIKSGKLFSQRKKIKMKGIYQNYKGRKHINTKSQIIKKKYYL